MAPKVSKVVVLSAKALRSLQQGKAAPPQGPGSVTGSEVSVGGTKTSKIAHLKVPIEYCAGTEYAGYTAQEFLTAAGQALDVSDKNEFAALMGAAYFRFLQETAKPAQAQAPRQLALARKPK